MKIEKSGDMKMNVSKLSPVLLSLKIEQEELDTFGHGINGELNNDND